MSDRDIPHLHSEIDEVTVYKTSALISRKVIIGNGMGKYIKMGGLPLCLDDSSIRIRIQDAHDDLRALDYRVILEIPEDDDSLSTSDFQLRDNLRDEQEKIAIQIRLYKQFLERIENFSLPERGIANDTLVPVPVPVESRKSLLQLSSKHKKDLCEKLRQLEEDEDELIIKIGECEEGIRRVNLSRERRENELRKAVIIGLDNIGESEKERFLFLEYIVPGARWFPVYGLNIFCDYARYTLTVRGMIKQKTGEDWKNARIHLSTAEAARWMEIPKLSAKIFGRSRSGSVPKGWRSPPENVSSLFSDYDLFCKKHLLEKSDDLSEDLISSVYETFGEEDYKEEEDYKICCEQEESIPVQKKKMSARVGESKMSKMDIAPMDIAPMDIAPMVEPLKPQSNEPESFSGSHIHDYRRMYLESADSESRGALKEIPLHEQYGVSSDRVERIVQSVNSADMALNDSIPLNCLEPRSYEGFDYTYIADSPVDIPSDDNYHRRNLFQNDSEGVMHYVTVPRESPDVFRFIKFSNTREMPLLAGPVDISFESRYLLTSQLNTVPPDGMVKLGAGVEQAVKVTRNAFFKEETSGIIKGNLSLNHVIEMVVENSLPMKAQVEIRERIALPSGEKDERDEKVKVIIKNVDPPWEDYTQENCEIEGGYHWNINCESGERQKINVEYDIQIPSQYELIGGNRRED